MLAYTKTGGYAVREYFPTLLTNRQSAQRLGSAIEGGTLSHAFLIGGQSGSGKSFFANLIAAAVNCQASDASAPLPCGVCSACRRIRDGAFPDVKVISKARDRATLGVDAIKDMREDMFLSSTEASIKVYIIDDAECMTTEAQNALLKVLEEPPGNILIMLLARECDKILTTVKSRTQYIAMSRFSEEELRRVLPKMSPEASRLMATAPEELDAVIMSADGRLGEAMRLLNPKCSAECRAQRDEVMAVLSALKPSSSRASLYSAIMALQSTKRTELIASLEELTSAVRDLITVQTSDGVRLLFFTRRGEAAELSSAIGTATLLSLYDALIEAHEYCTKNANTTNILTNLLARITAQR